MLLISTVYADYAEELGLTDEEIVWLQEHPVIRHAPDPDYAPFEYKNAQGQTVGLARDYLNLIAEKLSIRIETIQSDSWAQTLENVKERRADMVTVAAPTPERKEYMSFTESYISVPDLIFVRENSEFKEDVTLQDLNGKTLTAIKGWAANDYIKEQNPNINIALVPDVQKLLIDVSLAKADATVLGIATASYEINRLGITNLRAVGETGFTYELSFAARNDWPELTSILNKALMSITEEEKNKINSKWFTTTSNKEQTTHSSTDKKTAATTLNTEYAKQAITDEAISVAQLAQTYIATNPQKTTVDLQQDSFFKEVVLHKVGQSGFTFVIEQDTYIPLLHRDTGYIGMDPEALQFVDPAFWAFVEQQKKGIRGTLFEITNDQGVTRPLYITSHTIEIATSDDKRLSIVSYGYLDDFEPILSENEEMYPSETSSFNPMLLAVGIVSFSFFVFMLLSLNIKKDVFFRRGIKLFLYLGITSIFLSTINSIDIFTSLYSVKLELLSVYLFSFMFFVLSAYGIHTTFKSAVAYTGWSLMFITTITILFTNLFIGTPSPTRNSVFSYGPLFDYGLLALILLFIIHLGLLLYTYYRSKNPITRYYILGNVLFLAGYASYIFISEYASTLNIRTELVTQLFPLFIAFALIIYLHRYDFLIKDLNTTLILFGASLLMIVGLFIYNSYHVTQDIMDERLETVKQSLNLVANSEEERISQFIEIKKNRMIDFASDGLIKNALMKYDEQTLSSQTLEELMQHITTNKLQVDTDIKEITLLATDKTIIASTRPNPQLEQYNHSNSFNEFKRHEAFVDQATYNKYYEEYTITLIAPVYDGVRFLGYTGTIVSANTLLEFKTDIDILEGIKDLYLLDEHQVIISSTSSEHQTFENYAQTKNSLNCFEDDHTIDEHLKHSDELNYIDEDQSLLGSHAYLPQLHWCVLVEVEQQKVIDQISDQLNFVWITTTGIIIFIIAVGIVFNILLTRSLKREIENKTHELKELNDSLESQVHLRTKELKHEKEHVEQLLETKTVFVNQLSHDIRTPLTPILALSSHLNETVKDESIHKTINVIYRNATYLKNLVTDSLNIARLDSGTVEFNFEKTSMFDIIAEVVVENEVTFKKYSINIINEIEESEYVRADKTKIKEVVLNIIMNAIKFMPKGGELYCTLTPSKTISTISIRDTGIGIPNEKIDYIFEEFYKVDESRHEIGSSGLGLAICKRIIQKHNGKIWANSPGVGKGTTISFTLPRHHD